MNYLVITLVTLTLLLQLRLFKGDGSITQVRALQQEVALQQDKVSALKERNSTLEAQVQDLKNQLSALEENARADLGMIRQGETFYQYSLKHENDK